MTLAELLAAHQSLEGVARNYDGLAAPRLHYVAGGFSFNNGPPHASAESAVATAIVALYDVTDVRIESLKNRIEAEETERKELSQRIDEIRKIAEQ